MSEQNKIAGIRFSIDPITDDYKTIIKEAVAKVDTSQIWTGTDDLSTLYRGKRPAVFDATKACFIQSYREGVHIKGQFTIEEGPIHDKTTDTPDMSKEVTRVNEEASRKVDAEVIGKFGIYTFAEPEYKQYIKKVIELAKDCGVYDGTGHYASFLKGNVHDVFAYLEKASDLLTEDIERYAIEVTLAFA